MSPCIGCPTLSNGVRIASDQAKRRDNVGDRTVSTRVSRSPFGQPWTPSKSMPKTWPDLQSGHRWTPWTTLDADMVTR